MRRRRMMALALATVGIMALASVVLGAAGGGIAWADVQSLAVAGSREIAIAPSADVTTTHSLAGTTGDHGWYVSPVTVTLSVSSTDGAPLATRYRIDSGGWITYTSPFLVAGDGIHSVDYYSLDAAQGAEPTRTVAISIDTTPPSSMVDVAPGYQDAPSFPVSWWGTDNAGSGLASYDIQYKDGFGGQWQDWQANTTSTSADFTLGQRGHVYYFQARARDVAGNSEQYPGDRGDTATFVQSIANGGFESGDFSGWTVTGELSKSITLALTVGGSGQWAALLGSPAYGDSITPTAELHVPTDTMASLAQVVTIPPLADVPAPALTLWYRIKTYDVLWGCDRPDWLYDSLDITVRDVSGALLDLVLRDGNSDCQTYTTTVEAHGVPPLTDIQATRVVSLTAFAGRTVVIEMHVANRLDWFYNTWAYVDDVRVVNQPLTFFFGTYLPIIVVERTPGQASQLAPAAKPQPGNGGMRR